MPSKDRLIQGAFFLAAAGLLLASGFLLSPIRQAGRSSEFLTPQTEATLQANPELSALTSLPGGLRALAVNYLWIRSQQLHNEGRHYDAFQMAELITQLQPYQPGVWAFQAWNMAWNISVTTDTPEQRWRWVYAGVKLLRDKGIPLNPQSLILYKELSWIFFSKIGGRVDQAHWTYKQRWAGIMQRLLGAPPVDETLTTDLDAQTQQSIDAFAAVADAPLDKNPRRQGQQRFQEDQLAIVLEDPAVADLAERLGELGVEPDDSLLEAYNAWSLDPSVASMRFEPPQPANETEQAVYQLFNDPENAAPLGRMLAWVRAQILWNEYRMDPDFMLELMNRYRAPLDWRHAMSHGLYWSTYGIEVSRAEPSGLAEMNNRRNVLNSLKELAATGLVNLQWRPATPMYPMYFESADLRFIEPTHRQYIRFAEEVSELKGESFEDNTFRPGHINFLIEGVSLLVADGRTAPARRYYRWIKDNYKPTGRKWESESVEDFVIAHLAEEGTIRYVVAVELLSLSIKRMLLARGLRMDQEEYARQMNFVRRLYAMYQSEAVQRLKLPPLQDIVAAVLGQLLVQPRVFGVPLTVEQRSDLYLSMQDQPGVLVRAFARAEPTLRRLSEAAGLNFPTAFPEPPGLDEFRRRRRDTMTGEQPHRIIEN